MPNKQNQILFPWMRVKRKNERKPHPDWDYHDFWQNGITAFGPKRSSTMYGRTLPTAACV
eukprot:scaffold170411_cov66-Attheya_sp.AAC.1